MSPHSVISVEYRGRLAIITIDNQKKLNALDQHGYYDLSQRMREVAARDDVYITLLTAKGRYFSAGADVSSAATGLTTRNDDDEARKHILMSFVTFNLNIARVFYTHPKILVVGLNGPVIGLSAALIGFADFVYCTPSTFLLTPFASLGLVAEGGASLGLVQRLGISKANEALVMSRRIPADELLATGFVNKIFAGCRDGDDAAFRALVLREIDDRLGPHLAGDSLLGIKALIRRPSLDLLDRQNVHEVFAGLERFMSGVPQQEFHKVATGQKRHKL